MKYISTEKMKQLDRAAIDEFGIPSLILMENAGRGIADLAQAMLGQSGSVAVICGRGNNGGDGFAAARHLMNRSFEVRAALLGMPGELKGDPKVNFGILSKMGVPVLAAADTSALEALEDMLKRSDLILDAIFGVGLARRVEGLYAEVIELANACGKPVLAVDLPSGIHSDTGEVLGAAVKAEATGTLGACKQGLLVGEGPRHAGKVSVLDISIPKILFSDTK